MTLEFIAQLSYHVDLQSNGKQMKQFLSLIALSLIAFPSLSRADDSRAMTLDPSIFEVKTFVVANNAFRAIIGEKDNSPVCFIAKYDYERQPIIQFGKQLNIWNCKSLAGSEQIRDKDLWFSQLANTSNGFQFIAFESSATFTLINKICELNILNSATPEISCKDR